MSAGLVGYELLVGLTIVQRLGELVYSRRNAARLAPESRSADSPANFAALVLLQAAWLAGALIEPWWRGGVAPGALFWLGLALFLAGAGLRVACIVTLGASWNARARVDPGLRVVSHGPYRWVRHPNYLGVLLELVGLPLAGGAWWTLALLAPPHGLVLLRRMRGEDELLFSVPGYAQAMRGRGALLPRLGRR